MGAIEIDWNPSSRQLRQFAAGLVVGLPLLGWIWSGGDAKAAAVSGVVGVVLAGLGLAWPKGIKPLYLALALAAAALGFVLTEIALLAVFFGLFVPAGLLFRLAGRDALQQKQDPEATTYWQEKSPPQDAGSYLRPW